MTTGKPRFRFAPLHAAMAATLLLGAPAQAANHREAPITALDRLADITDFYAFVSYDDPDKVTFILDVDPLLEPANGPNYFPFDPELRYTIRIDNDHDAIEDVGFEFTFETEIRAPGVFTGFVGAGDGVPVPDNAPAPAQPGAPLIPPAITALDGPGSEGFNLRQRYRVDKVRYDRRGRIVQRERLTDDLALYAVPSNVGPRTMPDYPGLVDQGTYRLGGGVSVFAGTVEDPFYIDLGATFDSLNFRPEASALGVPAVLSAEQDARDDVNFASDDVAGYNVNALAIEVPIDSITADGAPHAADEPLATIGAWGTTSRPRVKAYPGRPGRRAATSNRFVQIQRMANPLVNELLIGTGDKDRFSMSEPKDDAQFADYLLDPLLARVLNGLYDALVGPGTLPIPQPPRNDLLLLVQYLPPIAAPGTPAGPVADLLRLNTGIPATPAGQRSRLGVLGGDFAGFPNGRRLSDDVVDIAARVVAGVLAPDENGVSFSGFPHNAIGDGVNVNDAEQYETFPYLGLAHSGRDSRHVDPDEAGCDGVCPPGAGFATTR